MFFHVVSHSICHDFVVPFSCCSTVASHLRNRHVSDIVDLECCKKREARTPGIDHNSGYLRRNLRSCGALGSYGPFYSNN